MKDSVHDNGGFIGRVADYTATDSYTSGSQNKKNTGVWSLDADYLNAELASLALDIDATYGTTYLREFTSFPSATFGSGSGGQGKIDSTFIIDMSFSTTDTGCILDQGGNSNGTYVGMLSGGNLRLAVSGAVSGVSNEISATTTDMSVYAGVAGQLIVTIDYQNHIQCWWNDSINGINQIISVDFNGDGDWAGTNSAQVGQGSNVTNGESEAAFTGTITRYREITTYVDTSNFIASGALPFNLGLSSWYDATDITTLFTDAAKTTAVTTNGDRVGCWADKSINGYDMTQTTSSKRPTYDTTTMTQNSLSFSGTTGTSDSLQNSTSKSTYNLFAVVQSSAAASKVLFGFDIADSKYIHYDDGNIVYNAPPDKSYNSVSNSYDGLGDGNPHILTIDLLNFVQRDFIQYLQASPSQTDGTTSGTYIGRRHNSSGEEEFEGNIVELLSYNRKLTSSEIAQVEDYLNNKHSLGLTR